MSSEVLDKTLVVKAGTSTIVTEDGKPRTDVVEAMMSQTVRLREEGWETLLVSSGTIALGRAALGIGKRDDESTDDKRAHAARGQIVLMNLYRDCLPSGYDVPQVLVDHQALSRVNLGSRLNAEIGTTSGVFGTMRSLRNFQSLPNGKTVPYINWNDAAHPEGALGDNDDLAALIAQKFGNQISGKPHADALVILTNAGGLYRKFGDESTLIPEVFVEPNRDIDAYSNQFSPQGSAHRANDISSKVRAALRSQLNGIETMIATGASSERVLERRLLQRQLIGTIFRICKEQYSGGHWNGRENAPGMLMRRLTAVQYRDFIEAATPNCYDSFELVDIAVEAIESGKGATTVGECIRMTMGSSRDLAQVDRMEKVRHAITTLPN